MTTQVLDQRSDIDRTIAGNTLVDVLARNAREHPGLPAIHWRENGTWRALTWAEYHRKVIELAAGLMDLGIMPRDFVALMGGNRPEHVIADLAAVHAAATPVTIYSTLAPPEVSYIAGHCGARVAILENQTYLDRWMPVRGELPALEFAILMDGTSDLDWVLTMDEVIERGRSRLQSEPDLVDRRSAELTPDDIATLIYTSGTTGIPKGVVITHKNVLWTVEAVDRTFSLPEHPRLVSFLPLAHIAERVASHYLGLWYVGEVWYCPDQTQVLEYVNEAKPQMFVAVPRVWEKFHSGLMGKLSAEEGLKRTLAFQAVATGRGVVELEQQGRPIPAVLALRHRLLDKLVLSKIRAGLGLDELVIAISTAAPIAPDLLVFFTGIGLPLFELWGMSELSGPGTSNIPGKNRIGSVGIPIVGSDVRIADDGELQVRGGHVTAGYFKMPGETAETFLDDGWLATGDLAQIDADGFVSIIGRKKDLIITAAGKNIAPVKMENMLKSHPLVAQVCVVGDRRKYLTALLVLDAERAPLWAEEHGFGYTSFEAFSALPAVTAEIEDAVAKANSQVARVEQIKKFTILPAEWTTDSGELTPTLKIKRNVVHDKYADRIEEMYTE
jgi:long-chain acyl-CoA synthetase